VSAPLRVWVSGKQCRTFGDLRAVMFSDESATCRFCKRLGCEVPLAKYGVRHYICRDCIEPREGVVLPEALSAERRQAFWQRVRGEVQS
jgi:hypothetical protein